MDPQKKTLLHSFLIFNVKPPKKEGALPTIYWYFSNEDHSNEYKLTQVGLIITFVGFCRKFKPSHDCDYIFTSFHEIAILRLYGDIWMSVSIESKKSFNRNLLHSILRHCRSMFSHFWVYLPEIVLENETPPSEQLIVSQLNDSFRYIVNSIDWTQLDFLYIFNSYMCQSITGGSHILEEICARLLIHHKDELKDIAILFRKHRVVHTTFSATVTRALAFGMRKNFEYLFLHGPRADKDALTWIIGLYTDTNGILSIYQPYINIGGIPHLLVAFKLRHFRIVLTLDPTMIITGESLQKIPLYLRELKDFLKIQQPQKLMKGIPVPFAYTGDQQSRQQLHFHCNQIDARSRHAVDINIIRADMVANQYDPETSIAFPGILGYYVFVKKSTQQGNEKVVVFRSPIMNASESLKIRKKIKPKKNEETKQNDDSGCRVN